MTILGEFERLLGELYPYRVPIGLGALAVGAAVLTVVTRRGWHRPAVRWVDANRLASGVIGVVFLAVALPAGWYSLSPLWERSTLVEASPLEAIASSDASGDTSGDASGTSEAGGSGAGGVAAKPTGEPTGAASGEGGARLVSAGMFDGADGFHFAEGQALIVETGPGEFVLRFEEFSIRNGPDLFVYLSADSEEPSGDAIRLGALKATDGAFNYEIPADTDLSDLRYAMVWCDRFGVLFASAALER